MKITVYGPGCARCKQAEEVVRQAVAESGAEVEIEKVNDYAAMAQAGILVTPAVAIDGAVVFRGRVPSIAEVVTKITGVLAHE